MRVALGVVYYCLVSRVWFVTFVCCVCARLFVVVCVVILFRVCVVCLGLFCVCPCVCCFVCVGVSVVNVCVF